MRRLWLALLCASLLAVAAPAVAAPLKVNGTLSVELLPGSGLPPLSASGSTVVEVGPDGSFSLPAGLFQLSGTQTVDVVPDTLVPGTELIAAFGTNNAGAFLPNAGPGNVFGGIMAVPGTLTFSILGAAPTLPTISVPLPLSVLGGVGAALITLPLTPQSVLTASLLAAPWQTGTRQFSPLLQGLLSPTTPSLITVSGFDDRTPGGLGRLQLVAPVVIPSLLGPTPAGVMLGRLDLQFVPEPSTALLLGGSLAALAAGVRKRSRRA